MSQINTALGRSSTASISFSDANVRFLANQDSGSVTMAAMRSKYYFTGTVTVGYRNTTGFDPQYGYVNATYGGSPGIGSITGTIGGTMANLATAYGYAFTTISSTSGPFASDGRMKINSSATYNATYYPPTDKSPRPGWAAFVDFFGPGSTGGTYTWQFGSY
jgi:hypothetical protein